MVALYVVLVTSNDPQPVYTKGTTQAAQTSILVK